MNDAQRSLTRLLSVFGQLCAGFIYTRSDALINTFLLSQSVYRYPRDLREERQYKKLYIISAFVAFLCFMFATSGVLFLVDVMDEPELFLKIRNTVIGGAVILFIMIIVLTVGLGKSVLRIYKSIIAQTGMLSSGEKDLTKRVSLASVDEFGSITGLINEFCEGLAVSISGIKQIQQDFTQKGNEQRQHDHSW